MTNDGAISFFLLDPDASGLGAMHFVAIADASVEIEELDI